MLARIRKLIRGNWELIVCAMFLIFVALVVVTDRMPLLILKSYAVISFLTFMMYAVDKSAAGKGGWRTRESNLHILAAIGGWPGAVFAQQVLRHKTVKQPFRVIFWGTVLLNCGIFLWLLTPTGTNVLEYIYHQLDAVTFPWT